MIDSTSPGSDIVEIAAFGADIDIQATYGKLARHIEVITAGPGGLVLKTAGSGGASRAITVYDHWQRTLQVTHIIAAGTTVTKLQLTF